VFLWSYLKIRLLAVIIVLEEGKSLFNKQYSKLLKIYKQIRSIKEKMEEEPG